MSNCRWVRCLQKKMEQAETYQFNIQLVRSGSRRKQPRKKKPAGGNPWKQLLVNSDMPCVVTEHPQKNPMNITGSPPPPLFSQSLSYPTGLKKVMNKLPILKLPGTSVPGIILPRSISNVVQTLWPVAYSRFIRPHSQSRKRKYIGLIALHLAS